MAITKKNMGESRNKKSAIWTKFATNYSKRCPSYLHAFFEGEDGFYYKERLAIYSRYANEDIIAYDCGGKDNVIALFNKIKSSSRYGKIQTKFFMDKDYGLTKCSLKKDLYETPTYSFENFYTNPECFHNILRDEFKVNKVDDDYDFFIKAYRDRLHEYQMELSNLNTFIILFHKLDAHIDLKKFKIEDFLTIKIENTVYHKQMSFKNLKTYYLTKLDQDLKSKKQYASENLIAFNNVIEEVEKRFPEELKNIQHSLSEKSHGKLELYFLKKFLIELKKANKEGKYFLTKRTSIYIEPESNGIISYLSKYAYTPPCLIHFINGIDD